MLLYEIRIGRCLIDDRLKDIWIGIEWCKCNFRKIGCFLLIKRSWLEVLWFLILKCRRCCNVKWIWKVVWECLLWNLMKLFYFDNLGLILRVDFRFRKFLSWNSRNKFRKVLFLICYFRRFVEKNKKKFCLLKCSLCNLNLGMFLHLTLLI